MDTNKFYARLKAAANPVLVYFWAPWCLPCRGMKPHLDRLATAYAKDVDLWKINADEAPNLAHSLNIYGIPTLLLFHGTDLVARKTGAQPAAALEALFQSAWSGGEVTMTGISLVERAVRGFAGLAVGAIGWSSGPVWPMVIVGFAIGFTAVYDRCPVWQALASRARRSFKIN